jgi:hypothetical protein
MNRLKVKEQKCQALHFYKKGNHTRYRTGVNFILSETEATIGQFFKGHFSVG